MVMANRLIGTILLFVLFVSCNVTAFAQSKKLVVYHTSGDVVVQKQKGPSEDAKRGYVINNVCILKLVTPASRATIIDSTGVYVTLSQPASYSFDSLAGIVRKLSSQGVTSKFFRYVWVNFMSGHHHEELPNNVIGGVYRGKIPMKFPLDNGVVSDATVTFRWTKDKPTIPFRFILRDAVTKKVLKDVVLKKELSLNLELSKNNLAVGQLYEWSIDENETTQPHNTFFRFIIARPADKAAIDNDYKVLQSAAFSKEEKQNISKDILLKWKEFYNAK